MSRLSSMFPDGLVLTDGAWGTEFQKQGLAPGEPADFWNLARPDDVRSVARSYVEAGSRVILTNTFRANGIALGTHADASRLRDTNRRGVEISREAAGNQARVFASVGPTGKILAVGEVTAEAVSEAFRIQSAALAEGGADALLFETFSDVEEARLAVRAAKATGLPIVVSFAFDSGKNKDRTMMGATPEQAAKAMVEEGVDAVGANCGAGPDAFISVGRRLREASRLPVWLKPNAGLPMIENGQAVYTMTPQAFASFLPRLIEAGASFVGGCCGTGPEFIRELAKVVGPCVSF